MPVTVPSPPKVVKDPPGKLPPKARPWANKGRLPPVRVCTAEAHLAPAAVVAIWAVGAAADGKLENSAPSTWGATADQLVMGLLATPASAWAVICMAPNSLNSSVSPTTPHIGTAPAYLPLWTAV